MGRCARVPRHRAHRIVERRREQPRKRPRHRVAQDRTAGSDARPDTLQPPPERLPADRRRLPRFWSVPNPSNGRRKPSRKGRRLNRSRRSGAAGDGRDAGQPPHHSRSADLTDPYPDLTLEVVTDVRSVNLHRRDADLAVRMVKPDRGNVTIRRLGTLGYGLYASRGYVERRTARARIPDTARTASSAGARHTAISRPRNGSSASCGGRAPVLATTTLSAQVCRRAAGVGLAVLPHFVARRNDLVCLDAELGIDQDIWLVVHSDLAQSRRVRAVGAFLTRLVGANRAALETPAGSGPCRRPPGKTRASGGPVGWLGAGRRDQAARRRDGTAASVPRRERQARDSAPRTMRSARRR